MRRMFAFGALLLLAATLVGCSDDSTTGETPLALVAPDKTAGDLGSDIVIAYHRTVLVQDENLLVTFRSVSDGRCPNGVYCFWEGQAVGEFVVFKPRTGYDVAKPAIRSSVTPGSEEFEKLADEALGYRLYLLRLDPYPDYEHPADPRDYVATLRIEKLPARRARRAERRWSDHPARQGRSLAPYCSRSFCSIVRGLSWPGSITSARS